MATKYADILLVNGDIDLSSYSVQIVDTNQKSLKQRLDLRLAVWQGEWKYYYEYGTPWRSYLGLGVKQAQSTIDQEIKRQIRKEEDVINIYNFKSSLTGRLYSCSFNVMIEEGTVEHALNLKDDFTYTIPSYSSGCDNIVEYQYWSSAPYDLLLKDSITNNAIINSGSLLDPIKQYENISTSPSILNTGELKDIIIRVSAPTESVIANNISISSAVSWSNIFGWKQQAETVSANNINIISAEIKTLVVNTTATETVSANNIGINSAVCNTIVKPATSQESVGANTISIISGAVT